jgi:hypothetical protein
MASMADRSADTHPILTLVIPVVVSLIPQVYQWSKDANLPSRRVRIWDEAKKRLDFWDAYLKVQTVTLVGSELENAKEEIEAKITSIKWWLEREIAKQRVPDRSFANYQAHLVTSSIPLSKQAFLLYPMEPSSRGYLLFKLNRLYFWNFCLFDLLAFFKGCTLLLGIKASESPFFRFFANHQSHSSFALFLSHHKVFAFALFSLFFLLGTWFYRTQAKNAFADAYISNNPVLPEPEIFS